MSNHTKRAEPLDVNQGYAAWLFAFVMFLPMLLAYVLLFTVFPTEGARVTGFLQSDQPMYMAAALRHFEHGFFPAYGLPYSPDYDTPRINVQLILLLLGTVVHLSGWDPGYVWVGFGVVAGIAMFRIATMMLAALSIRPLGFAGIATTVLFLWGGGALTLAGIATGISKGATFSYWSLHDYAFQLDPFQGYWFLNLGRNVFLPLEAFYHCLFFGAIICLKQKRYLATFILVLFTMANHPFTALELSLVVGGVLALETLLRIDPPPRWILVAVAVSVPLFVLQGLFVVGWLSPEHAVVVSQHALDWGIGWESMLPAYGPVAALVVWRFWRAPSAAELLRQRDIRILLVWFTVCFALINHDLLVKSHQPLHFTRGYVWTPLALLAAPIVFDFVRRIVTWNRAKSVALLGAVYLFTLFDNAMWFGRFYVDTMLGRDTVLGQSGPMALPKDMEAVFKVLSTDELKGSVLVSSNVWIRYLALVYTPLRSWISHPYATPYYNQRLAQFHRFLAYGDEPPEWDRRKIVFVIQHGIDPTNITERLYFLGYRMVERIGHYSIMTRDDRS